MGIYVKDIELPKEPDEMIELAIFGDGKTTKTGESWRSPVDGKCYYGPSEDMNTYSAFTVHPHGRLIDADALEEDFNIICSLNCPYPDTKKDCGSCLLNVAFTVLAEAHTVVEAEEGE